MVAQGILDLADALRHTIQIYRDLALQPSTITSRIAVQ
jgi:hypothetical protein